MSDKTKSTLQDSTNEVIVPLKEKKINLEHHRDLLLFPRKLPAMKSRKGRSQGATMKLLIEKLGFTNEELETIRKNSLEYSKQQVKKLEEKSKAINSNFKTSLLETLTNTQLPGITVYSLGILGFPDPNPDFPVHVFIESTNKFQHGYATAEGRGDGYITQEFGGQADQYGFIDGQFTYKFTPPVTTFYNFTASVTALGSYYLFADDGSCNSKEASVEINVQAGVAQSFPAPLPNGQNKVLAIMDEIELLQDGDDNIDKGLGFRLTTDVNIKGVLLYAGVEAEIDIYVSGTVMGKGDGSTATLDLSGPNTGMACVGLQIDSVD